MSAAPQTEAAPAAEATTIRYLGAAEGAELWGGTQADFVLDWRGRPAREVAVLLQDAAAEAIAAATAAEDGPDFRVAAARAVGRAWLEALVAGGGRLDPLVVVSAATLAERPDLVEAARSLAAAPAAQ